jgi:hypothetical protein
LETTPFLTADAFAAMIAPRTLTPAERSLVELLVQVVADWIRDPSRRPGLGLTDPLSNQAKLITYMVTLDALGPAGGGDRRIKSFTSTRDDRVESVTYADAARLAAFDETHLAMLGLSLTAAPRATFDSDFVDRDARGYPRW